MTTAMRLLALTQRIAAHVELTQLLREIGQVATELLAADRVSVFVHDAKTNELWARVADGEADLRVPADKGIVGEALSTGEVILVPDVEVEPRFNRAVDKATGYHTRTLLTLPMNAADGTPVGVMQLLNKADGPFNEEDAKWGRILAAQAAVVLQRAVAEKDRNAKKLMQRELQVAQDVQQASWPSTLPEPPGYKLASFATPATEAGGDTYDAKLDRDGGLWVLTADATGHGVGPALASATVCSMFRMAVRARLSVEDTMRFIHQQIIDDMPPGRFVTAFLGRLDPTTHLLEYSSAGHGPVYVMTPGQRELLELETMGPPLGIDFGCDPDPPQTVELAPGGTLALFTDGLFEAMSPEGKTLGMDATMEALRDNRPLDEQLEFLLEAMWTHANGHPLEDDVTVLLVRREAS